MNQDEMFQLVDSLPFLIFNEVPGVTEHLNFPGLKGVRSKKIRNPFANTVGGAILTEYNVEETIDLVFKEFGDIPFSWAVSPKNTPSYLGILLSARGMVKGESSVGMVLEDFDIPITINPNVDVIPVSQEKVMENASLLANMYGMGLTDEAIIASVHAYKKNQFYFAYLTGSTIIVGWTNLVFIPETTKVLLGGSATHPGWRGRNIYKTMVTQRLKDARASGANAALIQAVKCTSAPICTHIGFKEFGDYDIYFANTSELENLQ
jgi:hypothetical protein